MSTSASILIATVSAGRLICLVDVVFAAADSSVGIAPPCQSQGRIRLNRLSTISYATSIRSQAFPLNSGREPIVPRLFASLTVFATRLAVAQGMYWFSEWNTSWAKNLPGSLASVSSHCVRTNRP